MPNTKVEWSVAGSRKDETASDASGIATVTLDFSPGEHVVTAKVVSSGQSASFKVIATAYVFDVRWTAMYEGDLLADHPDLRFRLAPYTINVKVLDQKGAAVEGVNFVLSGNARSIGVQIEGADQEKVSTRSGVNFSMDSSPSEAPVELELQLSAPGASWIHHYKMGWLYRTYYVVVNNFMHQMSIAFIPTAGFDPENNPPSGFDYGAIELMVPSRGWRTSFSVRALGRSLQGLVWLTKDTELQRGDTVSFSRHVSDNGYLVVRAEDFIAQ